MLVATYMPQADGEDEPPALAHNPFSRPPSQANINEPGIVASNDGSGPTFALQATMVGSGDRLASVAGRVLKAGDEIQGYLLVAIHEDHAIFKRGGELVTVYVKPHPAEDDE
jgi:hypothetical protein